MRAHRGSARRYAEAAFQIADQDGTLDAWLKDLELATARLARADLTRELANPALPTTDRIAAADRALRGGPFLSVKPDDKAPRVDEKVRNLVVLLVRRGRVDLMPAVSAAYRALYEQRKGITHATVISAAALDASELAAIHQRLGQMTGGTLEIEQQVDPTILGGVIVRIGDRMIDGSVRGRLERLRSRLEAGVI